MRGRVHFALAVGAVLAVPVLFLACADEKEPSAPVVDNAFIGSAACGAQAACHQHAQIVAQVEASGHPHILTPVLGGVKPGDPLRLDDDPPTGTTWNELRYVVGGYGWKALFVNEQNQLLSGSETQYNIPTEQYRTPEWAAFDAGPSAEYDYECFRCHTVGPDEASDTFVEPGVQCEACHGMGRNHAESPSRENIRVDDSAQFCGGCHSREERVLVEQGFLLNYQQYPELLNSPHDRFRCVTCHDPHVGVRGGAPGGITRSCTDCHDIFVNHPFGGQPDCSDCHMPRATLSARSANRYQADVRTHLFRIHGEADDQSAMFETEDGTTVVKEDFGVTLDFACYHCHKDGNGVGGPNSRKTLAELAAKARVIHEEPGR